MPEYHIYFTARAGVSTKVMIIEADTAPIAVKQAREKLSSCDWEINDFYTKRPIAMISKKKVD